MAQCTATSKRSGEQCRAQAIQGATVCRTHGGSAPQVRAAAKRRLDQARLDGEIGQLLAEIADEPMVGQLDGLEQACDRLGRMVVVLGYVAQGHSTLGVNRFDEQVAHPAVEQYGVWLERYVRATKLALDAGIDERRVRMSEVDSQRLFDVITRALDAAGLDVEQEGRFRATLATGLRELG